MFFTYPRKGLGYTQPAFCDMGPNASSATSSCMCDLEQVNITSLSLSFICKVRMLLVLI